LLLVSTCSKGQHHLLDGEVLVVEEKEMGGLLKMKMHTC
jgi:hypothetical protein